MGLPHARGGVSFYSTKCAKKFWSSPRTWGCFFEGFVAFVKHGVFPTHVGVFPILKEGKPSTIGLPHTRGGASGLFTMRLCSSMSSPRTWGCFQRAQTDRRYA